MRIYLDLDETLIYSEYVDSFTRINKSFDYWQWWMVDGCGYSMSREEFITYPRPYSKEFISSLQDEYGVNNVSILTAATQDYAVQICKHFEFNIPKDQIIGRESYTTERALLKNRDPKENPVLVDNETYYDRNAKKKIRFLGGTETTRYIQIEEFKVNKESKPEDFNHEEIFKTTISAIGNPASGSIVY